MPHKLTITGVYYADWFCKLLVAVKEKCRGKLTEVPYFCTTVHCIYTHWSDVRQAAVLECGFEEMCHPPYSADQTPNDYHLLLNLKKHLRGQRFLTDDELKFAAKEWLKGQSGLLYFPGIENSEFAMNCTLTKAVIISKNKCMLIRPSFV